MWKRREVKFYDNTAHLQASVTKIITNMAAARNMPTSRDVQLVLTFNIFVSSAMTVTSSVTSNDNKQSKVA